MHVQIVSSLTGIPSTFRFFALKAKTAPTPNQAGAEFVEMSGTFCRVGAVPTKSFEIQMLVSFSSFHAKPTPSVSEGRDGPAELLAVNPEPSTFLGELAPPTLSYQRKLSDFPFHATRRPPPYNPVDPSAGAWSLFARVTGAEPPHDKTPNGKVV